jgi:hypothetical protein
MKRVVKASINDLIIDDNAQIVSGPNDYKGKFRYLFKITPIDELKQVKYIDQYWDSHDYFFVDDDFNFADTGKLSLNHDKAGYKALFESIDKNILNSLDNGVVYGVWVYNYPFGKDKEIREYPYRAPSYL